MAVCDPLEDTRTTTSMEVLPLTEAARRLGVAHQTLLYYRQRGKLTAQRAGNNWLVDLEVARRELEAAGFYERREVVRNSKKLREQRAQKKTPSKRRRQP